MEDYCKISSKSKLDKVMLTQYMRLRRDCMRILRDPKAAGPIIDKSSELCKEAINCAQQMQLLHSNIVTYFNDNQQFSYPYYQKCIVAYLTVLVSHFDLETLI